MVKTSILDYERIGNILENWRKHIDYLVRCIEDFLGDTVNRNKRLNCKMEGTIINVLSYLEDTIEVLEETVAIIENVKKGLDEVYTNE